MKPTFDDYEPGATPSAARVHDPVITSASVVMTGAVPAPGPPAARTHYPEPGRKPASAHAHGHRRGSRQGLPERLTVGSAVAGIGRPSSQHMTAAPSRQQ